MNGNPKGLSDRTMQVLGLGTDSVKMLALLRTYSPEEVIDVLPHLASTGFTGEQFAALRGAVQAHLDGELMRTNIAALESVNSTQISALQDLHDRHVTELQVKLRLPQSTGSLNRSTTLLSVIAIICPVVLGIVSLMSSCRTHP